MTWVAVAVQGASGVAGFLGSRRAARSQERAAREASRRLEERYQQLRGDQMAMFDRLSNNQTNTFNALRDEQRGATNQVRDQQLGMYEQLRGDLAPYRDAGTRAVGNLERFMAGDGGRRFQASDFQEDPGFQFRRDQGEQAINRNALSRGRYNSGAALKELQNYNSGLASQEFGNAFDRWRAGNNDIFGRYSGIAQAGQAAANRTGDYGMNAANQISGAITNAANQIGNYGMNAANQIGGYGQNAVNQIGNYGMTAAGGGAQNDLAAGNARSAGTIGGINALLSGLGQGVNWWRGQQAVDAIRGRRPGGQFNLADYNSWADRNN